MKNKHLWIPAFVFIGACVTSLIYSIIDYKALNPGLAYSSETIQFNYDGASDGKDPNGNKFDPVGFLTDDVIKDALEKSQLNYEVDKIRPYIAIENIVPDDIVEEINSYEKLVGGGSEARNITTTNYYPVRYRFVVYQDLDKHLSKSALNTFANNIVDGYCDKFYQTYQKSYAEEAYNELIDITGYDYIYQTQIFTAKFSILMEYAQVIYDEHNDFTVEGKSFKDLFLRAQQIINSDIDRSKQLISFNALSNDVELLKSYYAYLKNDLVCDKDKYEADLVAITAQAEAYALKTPSVTTTTAAGGAVVTVSSNTVATYDALMAKQIAVDNTITDLNKQIQECDDALAKLNSATGDAEIKTIVDELIADIKDDFDEYEELFQVMMKAYNDKYVKEGVIEKDRASYTSNSIFSKIFIIRVIKNSAVIMLIVLFGITFYFLGREIKKEKKNAQ